MLRDFVDAARRRFLMEAEELIQRAGAFADRVGLLDRLGDVSLRENHGFAKLLAAGELRGDGGGKRAARPVRVGAFDVVAAE